MKSKVFNGMLEQVEMVRPIKVEVVERENFERKRWKYLLSLPLMWILTIWVVIKKTAFGIFGLEPKINTFWFDGLSKPCRSIKEGAKSWRALDIIYNHPFGEENGIEGKISDYWIGMMNAQAVRNRMKMVKEKLIEVIKEVDLSENRNEVRLFSIASGSAQAVIEAMAETKKNGIKIKALLLDLDQTALEYSKKIAIKYNLDDEVSCIKSRTSDLEQIGNEFLPHIVEMIGFLDYRPFPKAVELVKRIYNILPPGGKFLTANICPNPERYFMKWVINWPMIYRKPNELKRIVLDSGFKEYEIIQEPLGLHAVAICTKPT